MTCVNARNANTSLASWLYSPCQGKGLQAAGHIAASHRAEHSESEPWQLPLASRESWTSARW